LVDAHDASPGGGSSTPESAGRRAAIAIALRLIDAGHTALLAGGCVRDRLRGEVPHDHDVATDATPARVREIFPKAVGVGEAFGVMLVRHAGETVEVATFRSDGPYADGRRPETIHFAGPREDAMRRDFTINGLFEDPRSGEIIDFVGGRTDLVDGVVRCIGDAAARLAEDRLRTLRAVRFAARFGYRIEPATREAIVAAAEDLRGVSRERIGHELRRMLEHPTRATAVTLIERLGLDVPTLDESAPAGERRRVAGLPESVEATTALLAWLLDRRDAAGAENDPAEIEAHWRRWIRAIVGSNEEREAGLGVLRGLQALADWPLLGVARRKRSATAAGFAGAIQLLRTMLPDVADQCERDVAALAESGLAPTPFIGGDDLIRDLGLKAGPAFGPLLERLYDAQLEGRTTTRREAIELAIELAPEAERQSGSRSKADPATDADPPPSDSSLRRPSAE